MSDNTRYGNLPPTPLSRVFLLGMLSGAALGALAWVGSQLYADHVLLMNLVAFLQAMQR